MTQFSGLWTTDASTPVGDQQASYTQSQLSTMFDILAGCSKYEGVALGYRNELAPSDGGANTLNVASGGAIVDGKFYDNDATVGVNIPSAGAGTVRKDRVVLQADWASFTIRLAVLTGDAVSYPALTTTSGTTYEIKIAGVEVDDAGNLTITDERNWAAAEVDDDTLAIDQATGYIKVADSGIDSLQLAADAVTATKIAAGAVGTSEIATGAVDTDELAADAVTTAKIAAGAVDTDELAASAVTLAKLAADSVDDTKAGNRVLQAYRRQGGSASNWSTPGTTTYTPGAVRMQMGVVSVSLLAASQQSVAITFPVAFSNAPIVLCVAQRSTGLDSSEYVTAAVATTSPTTTGATLVAMSQDGSAITGTANIFWIAIGPE